VLSAKVNVPVVTFCIAPFALADHVNVPKVPCVSVVKVMVCAPSVLPSAFKTTACVLGVIVTTFAAVPCSPSTPFLDLVIL
jgi:hypothetical protein